LNRLDRSNWNAEFKYPETSKDLERVEEDFKVFILKGCLWTKDYFEIFQMSKVFKERLVDFFDVFFSKLNSFEI